MGKQHVGYVARFDTIGAQTIEQLATNKRWPINVANAKVDQHDSRTDANEEPAEREIKIAAVNEELLMSLPRLIVRVAEPSERIRRWHDGPAVVNGHNLQGTNSHGGDWTGLARGQRASERGFVGTQIAHLYALEATYLIHESGYRNTTNVIRTERWEERFNE